MRAFVSAQWGDALSLPEAVGYGSADEPLSPIGAAVNSGLTRVVNIAAGGVVDFTAVADTDDTASRLASRAAAGEILLSGELYQAVSERHPAAERRILNLRGNEDPFPVRALRGTSETK